MAGFEQELFLTSVQAESGMFSHNLRDDATSGARQAHDGIYAGDAGEYSAGMRIRRPGALFETFSPDSRRKSCALASKIDTQLSLSKGDAHG